MYSCDPSDTKATKATRYTTYTFKRGCYCLFSIEDFVYIVAIVAFVSEGS